jgi:hypothetical protein
VIILHDAEPREKYFHSNYGNTERIQIPVLFVGKNAGSKLVNSFFSYNVSTQNPSITRNGPIEVRVDFPLDVEDKVFLSLTFL